MCNTFIHLCHQQVQAAQYQQAQNTSAKAAPSPKATPTTPTSAKPGRPLLNNSAGQNAITVRNAQVKSI